MYSNYEDIKDKIAFKSNFKGNSCKGFNDKEGYHIISYATEIYSDKNGLNIQYYSVTTSRLQNIIALAYYSKTIEKLRKNKNEWFRVS